MADVELVIKIPSEVYENIKSATADDNDISSLLLGIHEATPLPKGHGKLIDATILRRGFVVSARFNGTWNLGKTRILSHIDDANAIIEADKESERYY